VRRWLGAPWFHCLSRARRASTVTAGAATAKSTVTLTEIDYYNSPRLHRDRRYEDVRRQGGVTIPPPHRPAGEPYPAAVAGRRHSFLSNLALVDNPNVQQMRDRRDHLAERHQHQGDLPGIRFGRLISRKTYGIATGVNDSLYYNKADLTRQG